MFFWIASRQIQQISMVETGYILFGIEKGRLLVSINGFLIDKLECFLVPGNDEP